MRIKEQILRDCTNDHDRKLLVKEFNKWEKTHNKATILMLIATFFALVGVAGLGMGNYYFTFSFIPVYPLMFIAMMYNLKGSGLV